MAHTVVTVDNHMVRGYVHKHSLQSPACTIVSLVCFIAASLVFCYAQMSTEWQIEPQCVGGLTDSELVIWNLCIFPRLHLVFILKFSTNVNYNT